jgi:RNA polymerase sigma-70 factor (ECF subfamily)
MSERRSMESVAKYWTEAMPLVAAFLRANVSRMHDAQDLLQDVAVDVTRQFGSYDTGRSFNAWALGIARNKLKMYYREAATDRRVLGEVALARVAGALEEMGRESSEIAEALHRCMERVDPRARRLLELRYVEDLSCPQIAGQMSASVSAVKVALHRLRGALLRCVEERLATGRGLA